MPSKNDLSAFKIQSKNTLENLQEVISVSNPLKVAVTQEKAGRKPKPASERQTEMVGLRFTKSELETIKKQAGLIPVATYLKKEILEKSGAL